MEDTNYRMTMTELEDKLLVDVYSREDDCQNLVMTLDIGGHDYFAHFNSKYAPDDEYVWNITWSMTICPWCRFRMLKASLRFQLRNWWSNRSRA